MYVYMVGYCIVWNGLSMYMCVCVCGYVCIMYVGYNSDIYAFSIYIVTLDILLKICWFLFWR